MRCRYVRCRYVRCRCRYAKQLPVSRVLCSSGELVHHRLRVYTIQSYGLCTGTEARGAAGQPRAHLRQIVDIQVIFIAGCVL